MSHPVTSVSRPQRDWPCPLAIVKLLAMLCMVLLGISLPLEHWPALGALAAVTLGALALTGMPLARLLRRLGLFLPLVGALALSVPLTQGFSAGWSIAILVLCRATLSFLAGLWLCRVMPFEELLLTLRQLYVPDVLTGCLAFMHRFLFVLWDELERMRTARQARHFGPRTLASRWTPASELIGMLSIRSLDRGLRIHRAMLARHWDGRYRD